MQHQTFWVRTLPLLLIGLTLLLFNYSEYWILFGR